MSDRSVSLSSFCPAAAASPAAARPVAARPILSRLLRLAAPNLLNLLTIAGVIAFDGLFLSGAAQAAGQQTCKPALAVNRVQFSAMQPPTLERKWTAVVSADASRCATIAGYFEVGFSRMKENGIEIEFREQFIWSSPAVKVGIDFWADEAVESHWIDSVQACPCAK
jgi:hypothetical protein